MVEGKIYIYNIYQGNTCYVVFKYIEFVMFLRNYYYSIVYWTCKFEKY